MSENLTAVKAGERIKMEDGEEVSVLGGCAEKHRGHWYCATHKKHFRNQFEKDGHIMRGTHKLAWICHEHGAEQP